MIQNINPLVGLLVRWGFDVQIETAGTVWVDGLETWIDQGMLTIVCSPKTGKVHKKIAEHCRNWKYLIQQGATSQLDGLPSLSTQLPGVPHEVARPSRIDDTVWLQPCEAYVVGYQKVEWIGDTNMTDQKVTSSVRDEEQTQRNIRLCAELAQRFNYRISLQTHKLLGLP